MHLYLIFDMKYLLYSLFVILMGVSCQPKSLPTVFEVKENYALLKASHEITKPELEKIQAQLAEYDFVLDYSKSQFYEDDKIKVLALTLQTPTGQIGSTSADLVTIQYKYYGFRYDSENANSFYMGFME